MECCEKEKIKQKDRTFWKGIVYGLIPHAGCIAFIAFSLLGATSAIFLFKPLLLNSYFFYILIAISFAFATISAIFYFRNKKVLNCCKGKKDGIWLSFSPDGLKKRVEVFDNTIWHNNHSKSHHVHGNFPSDCK